MEVPFKRRLVGLVGLLRHRLLRRATGAKATGVKAVVFFSSCASVDFHHAAFGALEAHGKSAVPAKFYRLHGNLPQVERTKTFTEFKKSSSGILMCTDVAARGLDFPAVNLIVQFDPPGEVADYVHRVGRTGRIGQQGEAVLFLQGYEWEYVEKLRAAGADVHDASLAPLLKALPVLREIPEANSRWGMRETTSNDQAEAMQGRVEAAVASRAELKELAEAAFLAFTRAYAAFPRSLRHIFHVKQLHLGHVACSFGLKGQPSGIGNAGRGKNAKGNSKERAKSYTLRKENWGEVPRGAAKDAVGSTSKIRRGIGVEASTVYGGMVTSE